ncbi:MAG: acetoacetate decarboxylase family protein, partial [Burkholderiaceae bacterium]|nr:acetoacetate decarboxylase family protein [Burkholderiaceae bacterium]
MAAADPTISVVPVLELPSMPMASPSYPRGPYRFVQREYLIVTYISDADAIRAALPAPLEPDGSGQVFYEFIRMPDSAGFGDYTESGAVNHDTLTGVLDYAGIQVAVATMGYKHQHLLYDVDGRKACSSASIIAKMSQTQVNLKLIPHVDGTPAIAQLLAYELTDIQVHGAWSGPARLHL